jgi:hypothetical protein
MGTILEFLKVSFVTSVYYSGLDFTLEYLTGYGGYPVLYREYDIYFLINGLIAFLGYLTAKTIMNKIRGIYAR